MFAPHRRRPVLVAALGLLVALSVSTAPSLAEDPQITDDAQDAYRYPETPLGQPTRKPPNPLMSNDAADIMSVTFAKAPPRQPAHDSGYSVSVTVRGEPHASFNYLVGGMFGDECYLIHFLKAGETRDALATCFDDEKARHVGRISGSLVSIKGNTISAAFSFRRFGLPGPLKSDPEIDELYSFSCPVTGEAWGCNDDLIDYASGVATFEL